MQAGGGLSAKPMQLVAVQPELYLGHRVLGRRRVARVGIPALATGRRSSVE